MFSLKAQNVHFLWAAKVCWVGMWSDWMYPKAKFSNASQPLVIYEKEPACGNLYAHSVIYWLLSSHTYNILHITYYEVYFCNEGSENFDYDKVEKLVARLITVICSFLSPVHRIEQPFDNTLSMFVKRCVMHHWSPSWCAVTACMRIHCWLQ